MSVRPGLNKTSAVLHSGIHKDHVALQHRRSEDAAPGVSVTVPISSEGRSSSALQLLFEEWCSYSDVPAQQESQDFGDLDLVRRKQLQVWCCKLPAHHQQEMG
jgi:hypothetical protein